MNKVLGLFKSHYSLNRSILTLDKPKNSIEKYPLSIFDLLLHNKIDNFTLVEDTISSVLEASKNANDNKINFRFGLKLFINHDIENQNEDSLKTRAKYIIFLKNSEGYNDLIKISSLASTKGFYYCPSIDWKSLKTLWTKNLKLCVPFYDSCIFLNTFKSHIHVPDFGFLNEPPVFFLEDNNLIFDDLLKNKVESFCKSNGYETLNTQSIYYANTEDFLPYLVMRCIGNRTTCSAPNLEYMSSNEFNFEKWKNLNE